jgi:uncharacterized coiled-coil protein SlyX
MTINEYFESINGQYIEMAGTLAKNQCVDNANFYIKYVLGLPIIEFTNAKDFPSKVSPNDYDYILNTPTGVPKEGDLIIWNGTYGHIGVFIEGDVNRFKSFDENYPTGAPCMAVEHNYNNVMGWLRPKVAPPQDLQTALDQCRVDRDRNWNYFVSVCDALGVGANVDVAVAEAKKLIEVDDKLILSEKKVEESQVKIADLENKLSDLAFKQTQLVTDNGVLGEKVADYEKQIGQQQLQIGILTGELKDLKDSVNDVQNGWTLIQKGIKRLFGIG